MPRTRRLCITLSYGYDLHSLKIDRAEWEAVLDGVPNAVDGQGFYVEGEKFSDCWRFNLDGPGSLVVNYGYDGGEVYIGNIFDGCLLIDGVAPGP